MLLATLLLLARAAWLSVIWQARATDDSVMQLTMGITGYGLRVLLGMR